MAVNTPSFIVVDSPIHFYADEIAHFAGRQRRINRLFRLLAKKRECAVLVRVFQLLIVATKDIGLHKIAVDFFGAVICIRPEPDSP
jgi:hypothetical protein